MTGDKTNPAPMSEERLEEIRALLETCRVELDGKIHGVMAYAIRDLLADNDRLRSARDGVGDEEVKAMINGLYLQAKSRVIEGTPFAETREVKAGIMIQRLSTSLAAERGAREKAERERDIARLSLDGNDGAHRELTRIERSYDQACAAAERYRVRAEAAESVSADLRARLGVARAEALEEAARHLEGRPLAGAFAQHFAAIIRALKDKDPS